MNYLTPLVRHSEPMRLTEVANSYSFLSLFFVGFVLDNRIIKFESSVLSEKTLALEYWIRVETEFIIISKSSYMPLFQALYLRLDFSEFLIDYLSLLLFDPPSFILFFIKGGFYILISFKIIVSGIRCQPIVGSCRFNTAFFILGRIQHHTAVIRVVWFDYLVSLCQLVRR